MTAVAAAPFATSEEHLTCELAWLNRVLYRAVLESRAHAGGAQGDMFRGLHLSDAEIDRLVLGAGAGPARSGCDGLAIDEIRAAIDARVDASLDARVALPLPQLAHAFGLSPFERHIVLVALAPEIDLGYEKVFAYLQDDFNRRRPSVDLALRLFCTQPAERMAMRSLFAPEAPLWRYGLLEPLDRSEGAFLSRPIVIDEITSAFLLQSSGMHGARLGHARLIVDAPPLDDLRWPEELRTRLEHLVGAHCRAELRPIRRLLCHLHGPEGTGRKTLAASLCRAAGVPLLVADVKEFCTGGHAAEARLRDLCRQAILLRSALLLEHADALCEQEDKADANLRAFGRAITDLGWVTFLSTKGPWASSGLPAQDTFVSIHLPAPDLPARERLWDQFGGGFALACENDVNWGDLAGRFRLTPGRMLAALATARDLALLRGIDARMTAADLTEGCYAQSNRRIGTLARRLSKGRAWSDLTVPQNTRAQLEELCAQVRQRRRVYDEWGFARGNALGNGLCALFYGASGVGKTMAVEVVASTLQLEVYKIDLSTVVSKYIGETEKNLSRIFDEGETSNAILFFDEADALFGKRSEVKDAHDRYANVEINYLLQRIEEFDGLVILASNLRKNIDDGFFRRMHFAIEFPMPDSAHRYRIWRQHFPPAAAIAPDVDFGFLAERIPVAGGSIRNIVLNAAFLAAEEPGEIRMAHLIRATRREYEKIGRICTETEFGPYQALLEGR
jgi:AAA+ superfamily predicted ATPase